MSTYEIIGIVIIVLVVRVVLQIIRKKKEVPLTRQEMDTAIVTEDLLIPPTEFSASTASLIEASDWAKEQQRLTHLQNELPAMIPTLSNELQIVISKILAIPHDYHSNGNKSKNQLVVESGYMEVHDEVTEGVLSQGLERFPQRINEWVQYSEDQRTSEGWFLRKDESSYYVGEFSTNGSYAEKLTEYLEPKSACAAFIKREIDYSREWIQTEKERKERKRNKR